MLAPMFAENGTLALTIFNGSIVGPRMYFKNARPFSATIAENSVRPPTFEIAAAPNIRKPYIWKFQRAVYPSATGPFRGPHVPIGMIIKGYEDHRFGNRTQSERCQVVKVAGAVE